MDPSSRRQFLAALTAGTGAAALSACTGDDAATGTGDGKPAGASTTTTTAEVPPDPGLGSDPFTLGIASGDPLPEAVVLWTRLAPDPTAEGGGMSGGELAGDIELLWEVAADESFDDVVHSGLTTAAADAAHTVHVDVEGLEPDTWYVYRFRVGDWTSPVGRTRTAPPPDSDPTDLTFGFASCQSYQNGWYNAWRDAAQQDLDLIVFLGDYIYENAGQPVDPAASVVRPLDDDTEATTLEGYRRRYALYRSGDEHLRAAHTTAPWLVVWDDHEVDNNYAGDVSGKEGVTSEDFLGRRAAAYRAWWEHMPVRLPPPDGPELRIDRRFDWGTLTSFFLVDTRQFRADQACGDVTFSLDPACAEVDEPDRQFLGAAQEAELIDGLTSSTATWNVLGNQTVMSPLVVGEAVLNFDQWDGYPVARERLLTAVDDAGLTNTVVITGDIHVAGVGDVQLGEGEAARAVATELVGTSISSLAPIPDGTAELVTELLPWIRYFDDRRGWTRCTVRPEEWIAEYRVVQDNLVQDSPVSTDATFRITPDTPGAVRV